MPARRLTRKSRRSVVGLRVLTAIQDPAIWVRCRRRLVLTGMAESRSGSKRALRVEIECPQFALCFPIKDQLAKEQHRRQLWRGRPGPGLRNEIAALAPHSISCRAAEYSYYVILLFTWRRRACGRRCCTAFVTARALPLRVSRSKPRCEGGTNGTRLARYSSAETDVASA
ncbi:hypothetical protein N657DRAFT_233021 [Parathielavia appendiculata]|uniref:Uncharacterized protein n=1 Tax=Parathielavia appendiculata TaxID=2587402 RepID=A0AAN6UA93_9PEZI|nr:hypothetical protein N657DRAFT_233021 [Parathielavia appendiculata]